MNRIAVSSSLALLTAFTVACSGSPSEAPASPPALSDAHLRASVMLAKHNAPSGWGTWSQGGLTVRYPRQWHVTPYLGPPATVVFPLVHLSTQRLTGLCAEPNRAAQSDPSCFDKTWPVEPDGVVVKWTKTEFPASSDFQRASGRRITVDGRRAKLSSTRQPDGGQQITASVLMSRGGGTGVMVMDATVGPRAPVGSVRDIYRMLGSALV